MYNQQLKTFITAADCGSFTKAAEQLYISSTAVMKQINSLENNLGFTLFERTPSGVRLTGAGQVIYRYARQMIELSDQAREEASELLKKETQIIRVASSHLNPCKPLIDLWRPVSQKYPQYQLKIIPFEDDFNTAGSAIRQLGKGIDLMVVPNDAREWLSQYSFDVFGYSKISCAVPYRHPLAGKKILKLQDLHGQTIMMVKPGNSYVIDEIRKELQTHHPQITIQDTDYYYSMEFFNQANDLGCILLTIDHWKDVHPSMITIPVDWDYTMPYGLLYEKNPSPRVQTFIRCMQEEIPALKNENLML